MSSKVHNRKSFVRFDFPPESTSTPNVNSPRRRRSIAPQNVAETTIEENDDEAERLARRGRSEGGSPLSISSVDRRQSLGLSPIAGLSSTELSNQMTQCLKLNAENKINEKNAFQLKMIDFLIYTLKKQDPNMTNLQMASASLDVSAKIYGIRVDKVHADLLKIAGAMDKEGRRSNEKETENTENEDANISSTDQDERVKKKKKRKKNQNILVSHESLIAPLETYDPMSLLRNHADTQTSDMLYMAACPMHVNQGIKLNHYQDVILDELPPQDEQPEPQTFEFPCIEDFTGLRICPSYANFKFLDWSPDDEPENEEPKSQSTDNNEGEFHFDMDAAVPQDDFNEDVGNADIMMDCGDVYEETLNRQAQKNRPSEKIVDFHDIIANNPNPNATYEYSYVQKNYKIQWAGPSHWKILMNRNTSTGSRIVETCKQNARKQKKEIELMFQDNNDAIDTKFMQANKQTKLVQKTTKHVWSNEKVTFPQDKQYDFKKMCSFFNREAEQLRFSDNNQINTTHVDGDPTEYDYNNENDTINYCGPDEDIDNDPNIDNNIDRNFDIGTQETQNPGGDMPFLTQQTGAFLGDNLVSAPTLVNQVFIPFSQRAKKIDMRQLKRAMWKELKKNKDTEKENFNITQSTESSEVTKVIHTKDFSEMYTSIPANLSKTNAESLSPAIAFVTLLHLSNERNLKLEVVPDLSDLHIKSTANDTE